MTPNDKKLQRLDQLLAVFGVGAVQPDELIKAIDAVIAIVDTNAKTLVDTIVANKSASDSDVEKLRSDLKQAKTNLERVISDVKTTVVSDVSEVRANLLNEIKRVESLIPELPPETDLSEVFENFESVRSELGRVGVLVLGENIRNALESLQGDDRLDVAAIRGIDELLEKVKQAPIQTNNAGVKLLRYLSDVSIDDITNGETLVWDATNGRFIPGTGGAGISDGDKGDVTVASSGAAWTVTGIQDEAVQDADSSDGDILVYRTASSAWVREAKPAGGSNPAWGDITGTLANQTDLQAALDDKQDILTEGAFVNGDKTKLDGIETGAEVNTIDTVTDTAEIDLTVTARALSASIVAGSIDESKLDASVNASLDLADSAVQNLADLGITADATELNYVDGVTSAIQTQLNAKQPLDSDLTAIAALADPNADRILFWDDSLGAYAYLTASTGLTISGTNMTVRTSSTTQTGMIETATDAETVTGTDTSRATTPANITARLAAPGTIGGTTPGAATFTTVTTTGNIELGHASDTTLSRGAAGIVSVEGNPLPRVFNGAGAPATTPGQVGDIYIDTTGDDAYIAVGTASSSDWEKTNDGAGGGISDGDKGDITVSSSGTVWTIDNDTIGLDELSATGTPSSSTFLRGDNTWATPAGSGDVVGPASATDNAIARFDSTTGKLIQNSGVLISDSNLLTVNETTNAASVQALNIKATGKGTPANNDEVYQSFTLKNNASEEVEYARISAKINSLNGGVTDGSEDGEVIFSAMSGGTLTQMLRMFPGYLGSEVAFVLANGATVSTGSNSFDFVDSGDNIVWGIKGNNSNILHDTTRVSYTDINENELLKFTSAVSAVNEFTLGNAATGNAPSLSVTGGDTNISLNLIPKGTGTVQVDGVEVATISDTQTLSAKDLTATTNKLRFQKSITVESPTASEDISFFFTNNAITITEMRAVLVGSSTPSVTWTVRHGTDRSAAGAEVVTSGTTTTSTTTGSDVTSFNDATIVADSHVWVETSAQSGTVGSLTITVFYTED